MKRRGLERNKGYLASGFTSYVRSTLGIQLGLNEKIRTDRFDISRNRQKK